MPPKAKPSGQKQSFLRRNRDLILIFSIFIPIYYFFILTQPISPFLPREESFAPYERHYNLGWRFPFVTTYYLMTPENYQPQKYKYPIVLMLHGASQHMYGGKTLASPHARAALPVFALIPIAPFGFTWSSPNASLRPQALPIAMDTLRSVQKNYNIDERKIYLTGYSMGGMGVYSALTRYHGIFAAAAPMDAAWPTSPDQSFDPIPMWVFHGARDEQFPVQYSRATVKHIHTQNPYIQYTEFAENGHGAWERAYDSPDFWAWMIAQSKQ